jgi:soluble lytic murein transglycosylase-like protein
MENLYFGAKARRRARRRARLRRVAVPAWILTVVAVSLGVPGFGTGYELLSDRSKALIRTASAVPDPAAVETSDSQLSSLRFRRKVFATRPEPQTPAPTATATEPAPPVAPEGSIEAIIYAAAAEFGIEPGYLLAIAQCESDLDPYAQNAVGYYGLFQYDYSTWSAYGYGSIYDPTAQARTTAELLAAGQTSRWPNCA